MPSRRSLKRSVANATTAVTQLGVSSGVDIGDIFSQFAGGSDGYAQPSGRNAAATVAVVYCGPDPSIGLLFRKFGKKDSLTRMKAYEELRGRVEDSDDANSSALVSILEPFAAHYMRSALLDPDWRCRAALHNIVGLLVSKLKRHAVRYLPDILPSLYLAGLYDTHIEVCRSASAALAVIFPHQNKREMAIYDKFRDSVREEIWWLLSSECTMQELDERFGCSGGGSKVDASDESEERYDRAVCAALAAVPKFAKVWNSDGSSVDPAIATMDFMKFALPPYRSSVRTAALSRCLLPLFSEDILRSKIEQEVDVEKILLLLSATQGDLTVGAATAQFVQVLAEESDLCGKLESSRKLRQRICTTVASGSKIIKSIPAIMRGIASSDDKVALKWSIEELTPSILRALGAPQPAPPPRVVYQVFSECLGIAAANSKFLEYKDEITDLFIELARHFINSGENRLPVGANQDLAYIDDQQEW
ncbi:hypothetical protein Pmar_PMAR019872 [Perkinsus marinus ATCC 50983]|uniref:E3 ubiquitin-protein ligase listerin n=1 Tax=Perkinsus marinus (strain ATCC 50983 / TXsc) TaxID=423536 RepID=C5KBV9_PERM5|nr:hypothetical protein Pmar_PMAR019872 [Perkinsus marinus ATCC 50983]EER17990.1 hypothetical protein Pmar_PMAR019872 [Perkinsus marinus ATCC 50983]|eukprot:XP_002786194.1 hypothetical protein Pmar_PMAR019872 [Perkinsus marinus ATCC 50983]